MFTKISKFIHSLAPPQFAKQHPHKSAKHAAAAAETDRKPKHDPNEEIDSDAEDEASAAATNGSQFQFSDDDDADLQTPQDKRLKLAKKYLDEIEQEERARADDKELHRQVSTRLADEYLDSVGKLRKNIADQLQIVGLDDADSAPMRPLRHKLQKLPVTCVCVANDGSFLFSGSKTSFVVKWDLRATPPTAVGSFDCTKTPTAVAAASEVRKKGSRKPARPHVIALALATDFKYLAVADSSNLVHIWCPNTLNHLHTFNGHRDTVTALVFRRDVHTLFSASADRSVKVWSLDEMAYIESLFGHQAPITGIDALSRERAISAGGFDGTIRIWKIAEESQLIYGGQRGNIEHVKLINEENFLSASSDGTLAVWSVMKKRPLCTKELAHGRAAGNGEPNWISAIATVVNSDVIASGE